MPSLGLKQLIGPREFQRFMKQSWPKIFLVSHGHKKKLEALRSISALQSPENLFARWPERGRAWSPLGSAQPVFNLPADQFLTAYKAGHTIYLSGAEKYIQELVPWIRAIERDLEINRGDITCEILCSTAGNGAKMHFDPNMTLNFQLCGKKNWKIAPNECLKNPPNGGALSDPITPEVRSLLKKPYPKEMPESANTFQTEAGSLVFLPHGCWHSTQCSEPSMALLFTISGNFWSALLAKEAERALKEFEVCREMALVPTAGVKVRPESRKQLQESIQILQNWVNSLDADQLLRKWAGPPFTNFKKVKKIPSSLGIENKDLLRWINKQEGVFHAFDAVEEFPAKEPEAVIKEIMKLEAKGFLSANL